MFPTTDFEIASKKDPCDTNCTVQFRNLSQNASYYIWQPGDGTVKNDVHLAHNYKRPGRYQVNLKAFSDNGVWSEKTEEIEITSVAESTRIIGYNIVQETAEQIIADVKYYYSGNHGEGNVFMSLIMANDNKPAPYFGYGPGRVAKGEGVARCTLSVYNAPENFTSNQLEFGFYEGGKDYFHKEYRNYLKTWNKPDPSGNRIIGFQVVENTPGQLVVDVTYYYSGNMGDTNIFMSMVMANNGQASSFYGYRPGRVAKGTGTTRCTLLIQQNAPAGYTTNQLQFAMYVGGKNIFYQDFRTFAKVWK